MSDPDGTRTPARPRQVTLSAAVAIASCAVLVLTLFDTMARVRSADMRDSVRNFLTKPPGDWLGVDTDQVLGLLRLLVLFSGALAAAGVVLGVYALQRHRGARIGLSVVAGLLLFSATFVTGFLPVVVAVCATMLWSREARDWFDGRAPRPAGSAADQPRPPDGPPGEAPSWPAHPGPPPGSSQPSAPAPQWGPPPPNPWPYAAPGGPAQPGPRDPYGPRAPYRPGRPGTVTAAAWLTWVFGALGALFFSLMILVVLVARSQLMQELQRNEQFNTMALSTREVVGGFWIIGSIGLVWSLAAIVLAVLVVRRVPAARVALVVSSGLAGLVALAFVPIGFLHAAAGFVAMVLLLRRSSADWFAGRDPQPPGDQSPRPW